MSQLVNSNSYSWATFFRASYHKALEQYRAGNRDPLLYFTPGEIEFLAFIGSTPLEVYDFAEDADDLDWETALLITAARRDYFRLLQNGRPSAEAMRVEDFPAKDAELAGIPWLPRLILKAKAKLRGELPGELMFCCGGDRKFFQEWNIHPADFLRFVWLVEGDEAKMIHFVTSAEPNPTPAVSRQSQT